VNICLILASLQHYADAETTTGAGTIGESRGPSALWRVQGGALVGARGQRPRSYGLEQVQGGALVGARGQHPRITN
jgi:hypothetical protein